MLRFGLEVEFTVIPQEYEGILPDYPVCSESDLFSWLESRTHILRGSAVTRKLYLLRTLGFGADGHSDTLEWRSPATSSWPRLKRITRDLIGMGQVLIEHVLDGTLTGGPWVLDPLGMHLHLEYSGPEREIIMAAEWVYYNVLLPLFGREWIDLRRDHGYGAIDDIRGDGCHKEIRFFPSIPTPKLLDLIDGFLAALRHIHAFGRAPGNWEELERFVLPGESINGITELLDLADQEEYVVSPVCDWGDGYGETVQELFGVVQTNDIVCPELHENRLAPELEEEEEYYDEEEEYYDEEEDDYYDES